MKGGKLSGRFNSIKSVMLFKYKKLEDRNENK